MVEDVSTLAGERRAARDRATLQKARAFIARLPELPRVSAALQARIDSEFGILPPPPPLAER